MRIRKFIVRNAFALMALPASALGSVGSQGSYQHYDILRDKTYEQNLLFQAGTDHAITPAHVLRWLMGGKTDRSRSSAFSSTEFQPIVHVHDSDLRLLATVVYKF